MKLKDFLKEAFEVDVESSLTDDWIIAFIGPVKLTKEAKVKFAAILDIEDWVNHYPREIFGFATSAERFEEQLRVIRIIESALSKNFQAAARRLFGVLNFSPFPCRTCFSYPRKGMKKQNFRRNLSLRRKFYFFQKIFLIFRKNFYKNA